MKKTSKRMICLLLILAISLMMPQEINSQAAKKKKPKLNKSKVTLEVGKTIKLKVNNTKKKIKWSSSKKSVATISKKGKVKAKKAGKTTITAKVGNKKLKCKITVKEKKELTVGATPKPAATRKPVTTQKPVITPKPTDTPSSTPQPTGNETVTPIENHMVSIRIMKENYIEVVFSDEQKLTIDNFFVQRKQLNNGAYNDTMNIVKVSSIDNKTYFIIVEESIHIGEYVEVTVTGLTKTGTDTMETLRMETINTISETNFTGTVDEESEWYLNLKGYGYKTIVSAELPEGLTYNLVYLKDGETQFSVEGTPKTPGVVQKTIVYKDEWGITYTEKVNWIIGSDDQLAVHCIDNYGSFCEGDSTTQYGYFKISGGSGEYEYKVLNTDAKISTTSKYIYKDFDTEGTYHINVQVTDENNRELTTTFTWTVYIKKERNLIVRILDGMGNPILDCEREVTIYNQDTSTPYNSSNYGYLDYGEEVYVCGIEGVYDIVVELYGYTYMENNYEIKSDNAILEIKLPVYRLEVSAEDTGYKISDVNWYDDNEIVRGYGKVFYLPTGVYQLHATKEYSIKACNMEFTCNVKAIECNTASANVTVEEKIYGEVTVGTPLSITLPKTMQCYSFTPTEDGTYKFYSNSEFYRYTYGVLYNSSLSPMKSGYGNSNGHFSFTVDCKAGKIYYLGVYAYIDYYVGYEVDLIVQKEE